VWIRLDVCVCIYLVRVFVGMHFFENQVFYSTVISSAYFHWMKLRDQNINL
jgi:hypothetical protein